jgi:predicted transcriptional regulator
MKTKIRSQKDIIRDYLETKGSITFWHSIINFKIQRLSDIIWKLKREGMIIISERHSQPNGSTYVKYVYKGYDQER